MTKMALINNWEPSSPFEFDSILDEFAKDWNPVRRGNARPPRRFPVLEVHETEKEYIVNAELPVCN
jgi:HSP20 family molecular chaperone IbpA